MAHTRITPQIETPDWFPTEVREALDVCGRARLLDGANPFPSRFEDLGHPVVAPMARPSAAEIGPAEEALETYVHRYLIERIGETLERKIAVDLYRALKAVGTFTLTPRVSVCVGDLMRSVDVGDGRGSHWVVLDGKDGCGRVFHGRSASCPDCQKTQSTRRKRQLAEWRQNVRGLLEHPVFFPDETTGNRTVKPILVRTEAERARIYARLYPDAPSWPRAIVRAGPCSKCGAEFQATDLRRTRCDRCWSGHR